MTPVVWWRPFSRILIFVTFVKLLFLFFIRFVHSSTKIQEFYSEFFQQVPIHTRGDGHGHPLASLHYLLLMPLSINIYLSSFSCQHHSHDNDFISHSAVIIKCGLIKLFMLPFPFELSCSSVETDTIFAVEIVSLKQWLLFASNPLM